MAIHCACLFSKRWKNPLCQAECPFGCLLAGFGKGKWEAAKETEDQTKLRLPYQLDGYSDYVVFENKVTTLLVLVNKRRESAPDVKIAYHDLEPDATGPPGAFKLVRTHKINFVPLQNEFNTEKEDAKPPSSTADIGRRHGAAGSMDNRVGAHLLERQAGGQWPYAREAASRVVLMLCAPGRQGRQTVAWSGVQPAASDSASGHDRSTGDLFGLRP